MQACIERFNLDVDDRSVAFLNCPPELLYGFVVPPQPDMNERKTQGRNMLVAALCLQFFKHVERRHPLAGPAISVAQNREKQCSVPRQRNCLLESPECFREL